MIDRALAAAIALCVSLALSALASCARTTVDTAAAECQCAAEIDASLCASLSGADLDGRCAVAVTGSVAQTWLNGCPCAADYPPLRGCFMARLDCDGAEIEFWCVR